MSVDDDGVGASTFLEALALMDRRDEVERQKNLLERSLGVRPSDEYIAEMKRIFDSHEPGWWSVDFGPSPEPSDAAVATSYAMRSTRISAIDVADIPGEAEKVQDGGTIRMGRFVLCASATEVLDPRATFYPRVAAITRGMTILEARFRFDMRGIEYLAVSDHFDEIPQGVAAPEYVGTIHEPFAVTWERVS